MDKEGIGWRAEALSYTRPAWPEPPGAGWLRSRAGRPRQQAEEQERADGLGRLGGYDGEQPEEDRPEHADPDAAQPRQLAIDGGEQQRTADGQRGERGGEGDHRGEARG